MQIGCPFATTCKQTRASASVKRLTAAAVFLMLVTRALPAVAQDTHYWHDQFGNRALLLSGAVVGDPLDLSAVYYNPGGMALMERAELLLAGVVLNVSRTTIADAAGVGEDLSKRNFDIAPSLIAGEIPLERPNHRFAYSFLTRNSTDLRTSAKSDLTGADFGVPDLKLLSNSLLIDTKLREDWAGGTWAYTPAPGWGVGVSTFFAYRSQRSLLTNAVQLLNASNRAAIAAVTKSYDYSAARLLWKIGVAGKFQSWDVGVTLTTPGVGLFGGGETSNNLTIVGQAVDDQGNPLTIIATDVQRSLPAAYRSPASLAVGAARSFGSTTVHVSGEYFHSVSPYAVVESEPFIGQTSGEETVTAVVQALDSVFNVAVGFERVFSDDLRAYLGFHTDFNAASEDPRANLSVTKWDFYHVSGGATFRVGEEHFTLGGDLAFAADTLTVSDGDPFRPVGFPDQTGVSAFKVTILLGFSFGFGS